jgi:CheY-like chemotaxis protein
MNILYLEDSDSDIEFMRRYARTIKGSQISFVKSQQDAANQLHTQRPDVFLVDVMIDGEAVFDVIKMAINDSLAGHVVLLTAKALPSELAYYESLGCDYVIPKPFTVDDLDRVFLQLA